MKKTVLMSAAKKARIALAVMAVCGFTFAGAQSAFAENVTVDYNSNIIGGNDSSVTSWGSAPRWNVVLGFMAKAKGDSNVAIGDGASAEGIYSTAVGAGSVAKNDGTAMGHGAYATGECSIALGVSAKASANGAVALGLNSTADEANTVSVGGIYEEIVGYDPATRDPIYESRLLTRKIVNVADGTKNTDVATFGQIIKAGEYNLELAADGSGQVTLKTNAGANGPTIKVDASALAGSSGPTFDGTKLNTDIQNVDVAGGYKETPTNANTDTKDTIAGAINSAYQAGKDYTDKQLTDKIGTVTGGTYIEAGKNVAENLGKLDAQVKKNTDAIGNINNLNVADTGNLVDAVNKAYEAATSAGANVGDLSTLDTTNKANLVGAVNEVNKKAEDAKTTATDALNKANTAQATATDALNKANNAQTTATDALNKANNAQTTADNALDKANTNATNIGNLGELNTTNKGNLVGAVNEVNDKTKQNAKDIEKVNGRVDELGDRVDTLGGAVSKLDSKVNKVGAGAAALAALHPMEFDSDNKLTFAAGVGSYHGASAAAIGAFYRPSEQVMFSIAGNMGNGENMVNAGVSFALDRPSKTPTTKAMMAKKLAEQEQMLAEQSREIAELKAMVQQLAAKQNA